MSGPDTDGSIGIDEGSGTGGYLDVTEVTYVTAPTTRKRDRVVIGGDLAAELADVLNANPLPALYGLLVRSIASPPDPGVPGAVVASSAWVVTSAPAVAVQATATQANPGANKHLVVTGINAAYVSANALPPGSQSVLVQVRSSGGTILWQGRLAVLVGDFNSISSANLTVLVAPANQSVTMDFNVGSANTFETLTMSGYTVTTV